MPARTSDLLDVFEATVRDGLDALLLPRGAGYESGFSRFEGEPRLLRPRGNSIPGLFWFVCRYSLPAVYLEIGYGDKEMLVEPTLGYPAHGLKYPPGLIAEAAGENEGGLGGNSFVIEVPFMRETVTGLTRGLGRQWDLFEAPPEEVFDRALQIQGRRMIFAREEQRRRDRMRDSIQASAAFHAGDYARAVGLLAPYEADAELSDASRKMLELARRKGGK